MSTAASPTPESQDRFSRLPRWSAALLLCVIALVAYIGTLQFNFIYDDHWQIEQNPWIQHWSDAGHYFTGNLWAHAGGQGFFYRPLFACFWILLFQIFGVKAWGWHLANVLLHVLDSVLVLQLARRLLKSLYAAWLAALLFALHPVHVEVVSWVAASGDLWLVCFVVSALLCHLRAQEESQSSLRWKFASWFFFACAMLMKEPGITLAGMVAMQLWLTSSSDRTTSSLA